MPAAPGPGYGTFVRPPERSGVRRRHVMGPTSDGGRGHAPLTFARKSPPEDSAVIVMTVRDVMTRELVTIAPKTSCDEARSLMEVHGVRHLPVVESGRLIGIVSHSDVRCSSPRAASGVAADVMTAPPVTVSSATRVERAARLMLRSHFGSLPVVDRGTLTGIVTYTDLLHAFVRVVETATEERIAVDFSRLR